MIVLHGKLMKLLKHIDRVLVHVLLSLERWGGSQLLSVAQLLLSLQSENDLTDQYCM